MRCKVRVKKSALDYFRRLARNTNKEIQAYLVGRVVSPQLTVIEEFAYTKNYASQTESEVQWYKEDYDKVKAHAVERGFRIVGDLHSHPNYWPVLSDCDHKVLVEEGHRVSGICATMNRKTKVFFWLPETSLACAVEYVEKS